VKLDHHIVQLGLGTGHFASAAPTPQALAAAGDAELVTEARAVRLTLGPLAQVAPYVGKFIDERQVVLEVGTPLKDCDDAVAWRNYNRNLTGECVYWADSFRALGHNLTLPGRRDFARL
jgi:hypothetical protein